MGPPPYDITPPDHFLLRCPNAYEQVYAEITNVYLDVCKGGAPGPPHKYKARLRRSGGDTRSEGRGFVHLEHVVLHVQERKLLHLTHGGRSAFDAVQAGDDFVGLLFFEWPTAAVTRSLRQEPVFIFLIIAVCTQGPGCEGAAGAAGKLGAGANLGLSF